MSFDSQKMETLRFVLHAILSTENAAITDDRVRWEPQSAPRPALPHATLRMTGQGSYGLLDHRRYVVNEDDDALDLTIEDQRYVDISVNVRTEALSASNKLGALGLAERIRARLQTDTMQAALRESEIAVVDISDARHLAALVDARQEDRAQIDLRVAFVAEASEAGVDHFDNLEITGTVAGQFITVEGP